jgi:hypothetical protein
MNVTGPQRPALFDTTKPLAERLAGVEISGVIADPSSVRPVTPVGPLPPSAVIDFARGYATMLETQKAHAEERAASAAGPGGQGPGSFGRHLLEYLKTTPLWSPDLDVKS